MTGNLKLAEQLYTWADLVRILKVNDDRLRGMRDRNEILGPDHIIPGGGHKGARWSASRVAEIQKGWRVTPAA